MSGFIAIDEILKSGSTGAMLDGRLGTPAALQIACQIVRAWRLGWSSGSTTKPTMAETMNNATVSRMLTRDQGSFGVNTGALLIVVIPHKLQAPRFRSLPRASVPESRNWSRLEGSLASPRVRSR